MPSENVARTQQMYAASKSSDDTEALLREYFDPGVVWVDQVTKKGRLEGHQGFLDAMASLAAEGYEAESDPEKFEEIDEETVLVSGYTRLKQGETFIDLPSHTAFVLREGRIVSGAGATKRDDALRAIGKR